MNSLYISLYGVNLCLHYTIFYITITALTAFSLVTAGLASAIWSRVVCHYDWSHHGVYTSLPD